MAQDTSFIDFSYGGQKASSFHLYRVSDGSRYNDNLIPTLTDKTAETPGADGMYFFNTYYKQRQFTINFAYDSLTETDLRNMRNWLNGKEVKPLIFDEKPDRQYFAKVTGAPSFKYIAFDEPIEPRYSNNLNLLHLKPKAQITVPSDTSYIWQENISGISNNISFASCSFLWNTNLSQWVFGPPVVGITAIKWDSTGACVAQQNTEWTIFNPTTEQAAALRDWFDLIVPDSTTHVIFKGEGSVQFTCFDPYAYSTTTTEQTHTAPATYNPATISVGGTAPTPFKVVSTDGLSADTTIQIQDNSNNVLYFVTLKEACSGNFEWNSATGMVKGTVNNVTRPLKYTGNGMGNLEVDCIPRIVTTASQGTFNLSFYNRYI